ncbi:alcohol dehydrogenase catalytic domain-containing protein [Streptomyces sp. S465]|uniref:alcohol dehydrogenase catalytic domain-containing protein n=1 Tax=Streptomyces sp. S465 TaxID=2979468 RepID=UPI0022A8B494|nr:alcohol dehydrogenase catalytic domain-containing protein [Streptomyces sp. S465]WAP53753.1 alcohol dehydrogenase catalytic domain-containing protein [Streptomyces sp. S465]
MKITGAVLEDIGRPAPYQRSRPLSISELDLAAPGPQEVLVRVEAAGLCHSDLSVVDGNRVRPTPMLLGHESAGIVEEVGSAVTDLAPGRRVTMTFLPRCGRCAACATGGLIPCEPGSVANNAGTLLAGEVRLRRGDEKVLHHLGVSGFATHTVVDRRSVVPVDADIPPEVAAVLGCAVLTGGGAVVNAGKPRPGDTVVVVGLGGVGMAALLTALSEPEVTVIAVDSLRAKLDRALELGAQAALTPVEALESGVRGAVVIEAAGNARAFESAVELTAPGGRTVTVGLPSPDARSAISPLGLVAEGRSIIGSYLGSAVPARDIPVFIERWRTGRLPVEELISSRIRLEEINEALDELAAGRAVRQVITFDGGGTR